MQVMNHTLAALAALASCLPLRGAILFLGDFQTGPPQPTVSITTKIDINMLTSDSVRTLIFDNWVISDGSDSSVYNAINAQSQTLSYQINNGPTENAIVQFFRDNINFNTGDLNPGDGYFYFQNAIPVLAGDVLSFKPGTLKFTYDPGFMTPPTNFSGPFFATNSLGYTITNSTFSIPEPGYGIFALLLPCLLLRRNH